MSVGDGGPARRVVPQRTGQDAQHLLVLLVVGRVLAGNLAGLLELDALVDQQRDVAAVVEEHVRTDRVAGLVGEVEDLLGLVPVLRQRLALPGEHRGALRVVDGAVRADDDRCGRVVLGGEDVAGGPAHLGAERDQGLDEHGGLDGHVQRAGDAGALERLGVAVRRAQRDQAGHLVLGEGELLAAVLGKGQVSDLVVHGVPSWCRGIRARAEKQARLQIGLGLFRASGHDLVRKARVNTNRTVAPPACSRHGTGPAPRRPRWRAARRRARRVPRDRSSRRRRRPCRKRAHRS